MTDVITKQISLRFINLDPLIGIYGRFTRSMRVFRGIAGCAVFFIIGAPLIFLSMLVFSSPNNFYDLGRWVIAGIFSLGSISLGLVYVDAYISLARCSTFALRATTIFAGIFVLLKIGLSFVVILKADNSWFVLLPITSGLILNLTMLWLMLNGLWPLLATERTVERKIFASQLGESGIFLRPLNMLIRDLCRFAGLVTPLGQPHLDKISVIAAITAFSLEGSVYYGYMKLGWNIVQRSEKLAETANDLSSINYLTLVLVLTFVGPIISLTVGRLMLGMARRLRQFALRRTLRNANTAILEDSRPPILFLRSFRDDHVSLSAAPLPFQLKFFDPGTEAGTLEAVLLRIMTPIGPVITIGNPTDDAPPLGAARDYLSDQQWQNKVSSMIYKARLIIVGLEETQGLRWELQELLRQNALDKTVIVIPPGSVKNGDALINILADVGIVTNRTSILEGNTIAFLFDKDNSISALQSSQVSELEYDIALRLAITRG